MSSTTLCLCAMKITVSASYSAVPFMFTVAPSGSTKLITPGSSPRALAHRMVTGRVAELESVPNAVTKEARNALRTGRGLLLVVTFMFYLLVTEHGWEAIASAPPLDPGPKPLVNYLIALELGIASGLSWWGGIGFLARNTRTRRNSIYPGILQLGLATGLVCSVGLFSALVVGSDDPTEWMVPIGGLYLGLLALVFVGLANVTSTAVSIFASGLALRHVPALRGRSWKQLMLLTVLPCLPFVFWPHQLYDLGDVFLAYNGTMHAPVAGVLFADFVFLRGQRLCLRSIFEEDPSGEYHYSRGFNWTAIGAVVLGQAIYLFLYNPITAETHDLVRFLPASIAAFLLPAGAYWLGTRLLDRRIRAHREAPTRLVAPNV